MSSLHYQSNKLESLWFKPHKSYFQNPYIWGTDRQFQKKLELNKIRSKRGRAKESHIWEGPTND